MHPWAHWLQRLEAIGRTRGMNGSKKIEQWWTALDHLTWSEKVISSVSAFRRR
jgi:hypothetical protein